MVGPAEWCYLPHDITYLIFEELSHLDDLDSEEGWKDVINMLLVNKSWNRSLQEHMVRNSPVMSVIYYGPESLALAAVKRELQKSVVLVNEEKTEDEPDNTDNHKAEPSGTGKTEHEDEATEPKTQITRTGAANSMEYKTTTDHNKVYPDPCLLKNWMYIATRKSFVQCMKLLLEHGASVSLLIDREYDDDKSYLLCMAVRNQCVEAVELLLDHVKGKMSSRSVNLAIFDALASRHLPSMRLLLKHGELRLMLVPVQDMDHVEEAEVPPVSFAVEANDPDMVDVLLPYYDGDEDDFVEFCSPLIRALRRYNLPMMYHLVRRGVPVNPKNKKLPLPLGEAAALGLEDAMDFLIDQGADINATDRDGLSALDYALLGDDDHMFEKLLEYHPIISETTYRAVISHRSVRGLKRLLSLHDEADPSLPSYGLCEAISVGAEDMIKVFLLYGTELRHRRSSRHALYVACGYGHMGIIKQVLDYAQAMHSLSPKDGAIALYTAITRQNVPLVEKLIDYGANPNLSSGESLSALHAAVPTGNVDLIRLLLKRGGDVHTKTANGVSILDRAFATGCDEVVNLILEYGGNPAEMAPEIVRIIVESGLI